MDCPVCLEPMENKDKVPSHPDKKHDHSICKNCHERMKKSSDIYKCPICREVVMSYSRFNRSKCRLPPYNHMSVIYNNYFNGLSDDGRLIMSEMLLENGDFTREFNNRAEMIEHLTLLSIALR